MTIYFRYHRGTLKESLETQVEVKNFIEVIMILINGKDSFPLWENNKIRLPEYYAYDARCNQHLWIVKYDATPLGFICYDKDKLPDSFWSE